MVPSEQEDFQPMPDIEQEYKKQIKELEQADPAPEGAG